MRLDKGDGEKLKKVIDLLIVVFILGDLFALGPRVALKSLNEVALL
jgi:hypothetical protein